MKKTLKLTLLIVINLLCWDAHAQGRLTERLGNYVSHEFAGNDLVITTSFGLFKITAVQDDIIHVVATKETFRQKTSYAVIQNQSVSFENFEENDQVFQVETKDLKIIIEKNPLRITYLDLNNRILNEDDQLGIRWNGNQVTNYKKLVDDEKFIGLGEKTGPLNRRGSAYENWNNDDYAYEIDDDPIYASVPFYMGIHQERVYGIFLNNSHRTIFNFGASNDRFSSFGADDGELDYYFFGAASIAAIIEDYTWLTGRIQLPPIWSLGFQQCRWSYYPDKEVLTLARTFREKKIPADVIYLDIHYMDNYKLFTWDDVRFPDPKSTVDELKNMGFHVAVIVDPGIKTEAGYQTFEEGIAKDVFVKYPDGTNYAGNVWPGRCHFPDFTSTKTRKWWGDQFNGLVNVGVEGFWNDMNEPASWGNRTPDLVEFDMDGNKGTHLEAHNLYGMQMSRSTFEGVNELRDNQRSFILTRAAFAGTQRYSAVWTGDNVASDEHMLLSARMVSSMGLSGLAFAGPDIGGFVGERTPELFARWLSLGTFTPFFRNHSSHNTRDHEPWAYGELTEEIARNYLNLRYSLLPYSYSSFFEASQNGMPVARSLAIDYTHDDKIYTSSYQNQFLFGPGMLIAPVESDQRFAKVYLPKGNWYHYWSNQVFDGEMEVIVDAPLDELPVFVKAGSIIPMQEPVQYANQKVSDTLSIHIYEGSVETEYNYYEDDGNTFEYLDGSFFKQKIRYKPGKELVFEQAEGNFKSKFRSAKIILHTSDQNVRQLGVIAFDAKKKTLRLNR